MVNEHRYEFNNFNFPSTSSFFGTERFKVRRKERDLNFFAIFFFFFFFFPTFINDFQIPLSSIQVLFCHSQSVIEQIQVSFAVSQFYPLFKLRNCPGKNTKGKIFNLQIYQRDQLIIQSMSR